MTSHDVSSINFHKFDNDSSNFILEYRFDKGENTQLLFSIGFIKVTTHPSSHRCLRVRCCFNGTIRYRCGIHPKQHIRCYQHGPVEYNGPSKGSSCKMVCLHPAIKLSRIANTRKQLLVDFGDHKGRNRTTVRQCKVTTCVLSSRGSIEPSKSTIWIYISG